MTNVTAPGNRPMSDDHILDELFFACALSAFIAQARAEGDWPDPVKTRQRAYELFEREKRLAESVA